jgi:serine/threonine protein phosphatase PrpC
MTETQQTTCYGYDYGLLGDYHCAMSGPRAAVAISVGSDEESPSKQFKGDPEHLNEDALFHFDDGQHSILALADAHFGWSSSHALISLLSEAVKSHLPTNKTALADLIATFESSEKTASASETSFVVAIFDHHTGRGFGVSFGDSTLTVVGPNRAARALNTHNRIYVSPQRPYTLAAGRAVLFDFGAKPGDLILAFTDGIDECNYRNPHLSLQAQHFSELYQRHGANAKDFATELVKWALKGVDGHAGGQDNIALIVSEV